MEGKVIVHRIVSWWLAFYAIVTILTGYAITRKWFENKEPITTVHIILKWCFIFLLLFHVIYTFIFVNFKGVIWKDPKKHWIRIIQQLSKWLILAFSLLLIITGFSHYDWANPVLPSWLLERVHITFDIGFILSVIIHLMASVKIMLTRKKTQKVWVDIVLLASGILLITGAIIMEIVYVL